MSLRVLYRTEIEAILQKYLAGNVTAVEVAEWADSVEAREEIDYEVGYEAKVADALFELASPEINGVLTVQRAQSLLRELNAVL